MVMVTMTVAVTMMMMIMMVMVMMKNNHQGNKMCGSGLGRIMGSMLARLLWKTRTIFT